MCDCFNLGFPNWHGSLGTGSGRRLKGPEPDTVDDSICEEPSEFIEGERPRPQGSSPVDEYPETDKYKDSDKQGGGGSGKKGKRGFGSLFEKRSPAKMSQLESPESGVIVKMAKETCAEGLVVSGGKEGIFIKEVRPESPASKLLSVHEGDQILSATVYFDDVTYEDALQILEHAQPYKMELLLKRKPIKTSTLESEPALEIIQVEEGSSPEMRGHSKTKKHGDRISWPKFPSFSKSQKSHFKRSHSTSEADDKRKLELSPTTSDTESPIKSQEAVMGKTKKHKIKISSMKMKGRKSMSVEQPDQNIHILTVERVEGMENQQSQDDIHSPDGLESASVDTSQVYVLESESEKIESTKIRNECILPNLAGSETKQHKVELISLDKTLKTTDITVALADQESPSTKKSPEGKKKKKENKERSELKFTFKGNEKKDKHKQNIPVKLSLKSLKTPRADMITSDLSAHDNTLLSPTVVSHTELEECQLPIDINTQVIINESSGKTLPSTDMEMSMPKVDICLDMSDIGLIRKSPQIRQEQHLKETYVKTDVNAQEISIHAKLISITLEPDSQMEIQASKLPTERSIDDVLAQIGTRSAPKFKLQRVDPADFVTDKPIKMTDVKIVEMDVKGLTVEDKGLKILPSREDIEIPGIEYASLTSIKAPVIKQPKTAFTLPVEEIQAQTVQMVIDVDRVKDAVSKLPGFKLPKGDIAGLPGHQQITMTDVNTERVDATLSKITDIKAQLDTYVKKSDINALPEKLSRSSVTTFKLPKTQLFDLGAHEPITMTEIDDTKTKQEAGKTNEDEIQIELHKRENVEKAGMETIQQRRTPNKVEKEKETGKILEPKLAVPVPEGPTITSEERNRIPATYTKGLDKKSKKANISMPRFGITQTDIRFPDIGIGLPKRDTSVEKKDEVKDESNALHLEMKMSEAEIKLNKVPDSEYSTIKTHVTDHQTPTIRTLCSETMPEVPSSDIKGAVMGIDVQSVDVGRADIQIPDVEVEVPSVEVEIPKKVYKDIDVKINKRQISFPKIGVKAPEDDVSVLKPDISLPEGNMEVKLPEVEIEVPELQVEVKDTVGSPSRFKIPTLKFPKFGTVAPIVTVELPDVDKDIKLHGTERPEPKLSISGKVHAVDFEKQSYFKKSSVKIASIDVDVKTKGLELEGQGSEFKLPNQGISLPKVKGPEIDLGVSKKDIDVTLPETNVEIQPPDVELKVSSGDVEMPEGAATEIDVKMKKPRMSFGWFSKPEVKAPEVDVSLPKVGISIPEGKVDFKEPEVEFKAPESQVEVKHDIELQGQGSKFKLPKFGISLPKVKSSEIDLSVSKTDVDVNLPERIADIQLPDVEVGVPSVKVEIPEAVSKDIDVKMKKPRMSFPKFGFSKPEVKAPEVDVSLPEVDISLPEGKVEVKEPEVEIEAPEIQAEVKDTVGSPSRFKMPTFKFPQFGAAAPNITVEVPDVDKDIKVHESEIPETKLTMSAINIEKPSVDLKGPSIDLDVKSKRLDIVTLPEASVEVQPHSTELKVPSGKDEIPEGVATEMDVKMKKPRMSFGWFSKSEVKAAEVDVSLPKGDISLPEVKVEVKESEVEIKAPENQVEMKHGIELEGQGSKFKLPKFGISLPKVKGPEFDVSISKTDVDVNLLERRADHQLPDVEVGVPSVEVEIPEAVSKDIDVKMKKPRMSFPKFGFSKPEVKAPDVDVSLPEVDISLPEGKVEIKEPEVEIEAPEIQTEVKDTVGSPSRFKMPTLKFPQFGAAAPNITVEVPDVDKDIKVHESEIPETKLTMSAINIEKPSVDLKGPSIDLDVKSKRLDIVTLPEASVEVQPHSTELKVPSGKDEIPEGVATEMDVKMKKPRMSFGWFSKSEVKAAEVDVSLPKGDISLPEVKVEVKESEVEIKAPENQVEMKHGIELEGQGSKFKLPKFGISLPKVKGPEFDLSISKTDVDVNLLERRADIQLPDVEVGVPSVEVEIPEAVSKDIDVKMKKPRMSFPKFGFSKPEVKAPEVDVSLPEVDISLPEGKVEVKEPEVEIEAPEIQAEVKDTVGSPSRFKMPTLKLPQFGVAAPNITVEVPDVDKDIKVHESEIPETKLTMSAINIEKPSVDLKGPSIDLDVKSKRLDIVTLPEASVEVQPHSTELKVPSGKDEIPEGVATEMDVKMKKPRMSFGWFSKSEVKAAEVDVSLPKGDISLPEVKVEVKESEVEIKAPENQVEMKHGIELEGQGSKFKLPKFGISLPKVKGPEFDVSISKTDVDVNLPERRADHQLPDVEVGVPSVEVEIPEAVSKDIDVKMKKPRMSFPKFGFSKPEVKAPEVDVSLPEVDISLPEGKVEVKEPEVEIEAPEIQAEVKDTVGSPSRFKMPTLKFPQFGAAAPNITVEVPDVDKDSNVHESEIPETKLTMSAINIEKPSVDLKGRSIDLDVKSKRLDIVTLPEASVEVQPHSTELKVPSGKDEIPEGVATEMDVKMKKPRMSFGWFSKSEVKAAEVDVSLPKGDISLPEVKVEVKESEVEIKAPENQVEMKHGIELEGQGSKFKLPKFGISLPKVKGPEFDVSISKTDVDVNLPERRADHQLPDVEVGVPSVEVEIPKAVSKDIDVKMKKPRMSFPKFGFSKPEVKAPEVDVSLPEVDISFPEEKVEVKEPEVEIEAPEIQAEVKDTVGSPSRFKMPTFKFPQFGAAAPNITVEVPDVDKDIKVHESEIPETKLTMSAINIEKPSVDLKGPSIDVDVKSKTLEIVTLPEASADGQPPRIELKVSSGEVEMPEGAATEIDVKMKKPRMSFGWFSKPEVKSPVVNVSLPKGDISLPEVKVEVKESEVEIKAPENQVEMKHGIELEGQRSKFKLPQFGISLPKVKGPEIGLSVSTTDVDVDLPERRADQLLDVEVGVPSVEVEIPEAVSKDIDVKMKKPRMSFPTFGFSKPEVKGPEVDVSLPKVDISLPEGKVEVKEPEVEIEAPEIQVEIKHDVEHEGQGSIFKLSTFGMSLPKVKGPEMDLSLSKKVIEVTLPEASVEVQPPSVELKVPSGEIKMPDGAATGIDVKMNIPQMSFGWFSKPEVKSPEVDVSLPKVNISLPEGNVEVKEPEVEMKALESQVEMKHEGLSVDGKLQTSEMAFKMTTFKFPTFGATSKVVVDVSDKEKDINVPGVEIIDQLLGASLQIDLPEHGDTVDIKGSREVQLHDAGSERHSVKGGMAIAEVDVPEVEVSKLTIDDKGNGSPSKGQESPNKGQGSPSKFKLPSFKMPRLSISKSKPENEHDDINPNVILENYEIQVKPQEPEKSPKLTLTTFGEVLRSIDVEFDVPKLEEVEEKLTGSREDITASGKTELNAQTSVETQSMHKEEEAKEKSKFGWFKFPTVGLSSSESTKTLEKYTSEKEGSEKSPDSVEQDVSLTFSVHSSDAFADISSTVTSEQFGPSLASPTKVTVKYSDSIATEVQGDVITSTARTKLIAFEPYLAEKVTTPMSSGVSSSSVDTLKLESGTHVSTSNIQAIPDTQKATLLTDFGLQTGTAGVSSASWSVDDTNKTQSKGQTVIERHVVMEMSGTDRETVFITQKVTHVFGAEPISDETASSIKQMKDTMQSEKMKFFDGAELE